MVAYFMRTLVWLVIVLVISFPTTGALQVQADLPVVDSPRPGEVLRGVVQITGTDDLPGYLFTEVAFAYSNDQTGTWFLVSTTNRPVTSGRLANWDTTIITDGNYTLRLRVILADGTNRETVVAGLRVRNYSPVETPPAQTVTPFGGIQSDPGLLLTSSPSANELPTLPPLPTPLPDNPAILSPGRITSSILMGGAGVLAAFFFFRLYLHLRQK